MHIQIYASCIHSEIFQDLITAGDTGFLRNALLRASHWDIVNASSYDPQLKALISVVWPVIDSSSAALLVFHQHFIES